jgi:hypothetical protein
METMVLLGTEDVKNAGWRMVAAAQEMTRAASQIDEALSRQRQFMDDWLVRFEMLMQQGGK